MRAVILLFLAAVALSAAALPQIPDSLTRTDSKAAWMMEHVWDDFDFDDCAAYADELGVGGRVATYIMLMPHADEATRRNAPEALVAKATTPCSRTQLKRYIEGYLLDRDSQVVNEQLYIRFADAMLEAGYPDADETLRLRRLASMASEGSPAPDFPLSVSGGAETLFSEVRGGRLTLLLIHDLGCEDCARFEKSLLASLRVSALVAGGELRVVAVHEVDDSVAESDSRIPAAWIDATTRIDIGSLYAMSGMPTLYLIAPDGTILRKDIDPQLGGRGVEQALE